MRHNVATSERTGHSGPTCEGTSERTSILSEEDPAPNYYDLFPEYADHTLKALRESANTSNTSSLSLKPYAITLYPFTAEFPNELSFQAGEIVHLIKYVDSEWVQGTKDNLTGIFPLSYVNVIVDCREEGNDATLINKNVTASDHNIDTLGTDANKDHAFAPEECLDAEIADTKVIIESSNDGVADVGRRLSSTEDSFEDFVVIRSSEFRPDKSRRVSEPHRPAPPAPPEKQSVSGNTHTENAPGSSSGLNPTADTTNSGVDAKQRRRDQRQNVISELVLTEKEYVRDLKLTYEVFQLYDPRFLESRGIDVAVLFGNIFDVIQVAEELLDMILKAMKGCNEEAQTVGPCFTIMAEKLQTVYGKYCGNHEAALILLKKYESNEEILTVFNKGIETLRHQIACFDMSSILIKPVQRILKYPLMLRELVKFTDDDHPDKPAIEEACKTMTHVASYINESKRRKDIVSKYLDNENTLRRKIANLNMHSVAKISTRLSTKLSASLGLTNVAVDPEFEELERQFRSVEKCTWQLAKDVEQCLAYISTEALCGEVISDFLFQYYQGSPNPEAEKLRNIRSTIRSTLLQELRSCLERRVVAPLQSLGTLLEGPAVLVTKRHDKLLDYDAAISKSEKYKDSRIVQEELTTAKSNFEALTQQLLEELPILIDAAAKVLINCITALAHARKLLCGKITKRYLALCENSPQLSSQDIVESFLVNHNLLWNQITRFSFAGSNPRIEQGQQTWCPQTESQRILLKSKYASERLYMVIENVRSTSSLDMEAASGTVVAVIKQQDPMGNTSRWFVDNGITKGFLPAEKLSPVQQKQPHPTDQLVESKNSTDMPDLISMDSPEKEKNNTLKSHMQELCSLNINFETKKDHSANTAQPRRLQQNKSLSNEFYFAMYDFCGNLPGTLSINQGQVVRIIRTHDEKGNDAWWLVEDRNQHRGYVPQNYLSPYTNVNFQSETLR